MAKIVSALSAIAALPPKDRWTWLKNRLRTALGLPARLDSLDRHILEEQILPAYASRPDLKKALFVGCDWYTAHYPKLLPGVDIWSMDTDPSQAKYGAKQHLVASIQSVDQHFLPASLDLIVCNGVFGYGLNATSELQLAMKNCLACLRPGGELMLGWNDVPAFAPFDPCTDIEKAGFVRSDLQPLGRWRTVLDMPTRHTFEAYRRP